MLTYQSIVNYYLDNPPFEIQDQARYIKFVQNAIEETLLLLSENEPIVEEKTVWFPKPTDLEPDLDPSSGRPTYKTGTVTDTTGDYVWMDLYTDTNAPVHYLDPPTNSVVNPLWSTRFKRFIDPKYMSFILFRTKDQIPTLINQYVSYEVVQSAIRDAQLWQIIALRDGIRTMLDWLNDPVSKIVYRDSKIKIKPEVEYYVIYNRFRDISEVKPPEYRIFNDILAATIIINAYESSLFQQEDGVSSFSMSGLSISFNTARVEERVRSARDRRDKLLSTIAFDGEDIGTF